MYETIMQHLTPWLAGIGGVTGAGTIIYLIVRLILGRVISKNETMLKKNYDTDAMSQAVADKLAGKTLNIDVTAVTENALKKTANALDNRIDTVADTVNSLKAILVAIGKGVVKLKALTKEEAAELTEAIRTLEASYTPIEPSEKMTVLLQPVEIPTEGDSGDTAPSGGVNFDDLEG